MYINVRQFRWLVPVGWAIILSLPARADGLKGALPVPIAQTAKQESKASVSEAQSESSEESYVEEGPNDPLENINRVMFGINELVDFVLLRPVAEIYRAITPEPVRNGVANALDNLYTPVSFLNHVLQGEPERATETLFRFLVNSTFGIAGFVDVTTDLGYSRHDTDFNQTLMTWGVDSGPYLVLPIVGPSSFRGGIGLVADYYSDPLNLYLINPHHHKYRYWLTVRYGLDIVRNREKVIETIDNIRKDSLDMYVTMRSIYFQRQAYLAEQLKSKNSPDEAKKEDKSNTS